MSSFCGDMEKLETNLRKLFDKLLVRIFFFPYGIVSIASQSLVVQYLQIMESQILKWQVIVLTSVLIAAQATCCLLFKNKSVLMFGISSVDALDKI